MISASFDSPIPGSRVRTPSRARGFSLIEVAIAIFIISLLLGSILVPLIRQVEQRQISDTQKALDEIRDALLGFAVAKGYLPCPDLYTNGSENLNGSNSQCDSDGISNGVAVGRLPHVDLGLGNSDLWGNRFTYVVNELFARRGSSTPFTLSTAGNDIQICATSACVAAAKLSTKAVFAVVSHGRNGAGAINLLTTNQNAASASADEQENYDTDGNIVSRPQFTGGAAASQFDDIVIWVSRFTLFNRMVAAGKLP